MIHATVIGNLGADAELKFSQGGNAYLKLRVAASYKDRDKEHTTWVGGTVFGKRAEALGKLGLSKGDKIGLVGTLYTREHEGKTYVDMVVNEVELLGGRRTERATSGGGNGRAAAPTADAPMPDDFGLGGDDF